MRQANHYQIRSVQTSPGAQITLFDSVETPLGLFFWNADKMVLSVLIAVFGAILGLLGGAFLGLETGGPLVGSLSGIACSVMMFVVLFLKTIRE